MDFILMLLFLITSCADSSKKKKKVNNAPVLPLVILGSRWYLLVFVNYSWGKTSSFACFQVRRQRWFLLYVGLLWLSSSCSWNTFGSASHLFNQLQNPGWIDSCETFCFVLLLQISFKTLLNQVDCTYVFSQVSLLEREFSTLCCDRGDCLCRLSGTWWQCRFTVKLLVRLMETPGVMLS